MKAAFEIAIATGLGALPAVGAAADAPAKAIEPSSPWTLEGSEERCSLLRNFGSGEDGVQLQIDSFGRADKFAVTLVGEPVPRQMSLREELSYAFDADPAPRERVASTGGRSGRADWVKFDTGFKPPRPEPERADRSIEEGFAAAAQTVPADADFERRVRSLSVQFDRDSRLELALDSMAEPLAALRGCLEQLHEHWGLDPAVQKQVARFPIPDPAAVREIMADYPDVMASEQMSAYIPVRVMVDAAGTPGACVAQIPDVEGDFTTAVCSGLRRRFTPAADLAGNAVPSFYQVHVLYSMD